jgi:hypothetical protein
MTLEPNLHIRCEKFRHILSVILWQLFQFLEPKTPQTGIMFKWAQQQ